MCGCNKKRAAAPLVVAPTQVVPKMVAAPKTAAPKVAAPVVPKKAPPATRAGKRVVAAPLTTAQWGPPVWTILHTLVELSEGKGSSVDPLWRGLLINLRGLLPCPECQRHYSDWWASVPIPVTGNFVGALRMWLLTLHNDVNRRNKGRVWAEADVRRTYAGGREERLAAVAAAQEKLRSLGLAELADGFRHVIAAV